MDEKFPLALPEGTILAGQYMIEKVLGQGGFGITYRAVDHKTNQKVAVKEFFPDTLAYREVTTVISYPGERSESYGYGKESFLQEAQTLAEFIGNENIVRIHSYFEENGTAYFVMDYIEGKSFDEYIKERGGKISVEEAENILIPMMDALNIVHSKGIVHRDVTPDNIYLTNEGTVKLLDFGAARYSLGDKSRSLDVILKHGFAPKEQYTRRGKQGPFTDIYSLGATFYFAITGKRPPDSVERLDEDDLIPPSNLGVDITEYQERAILQALSVQPADRFQTMADFKSVLLNESNVKKQIFFTAPEITAASVGNQEQSVIYQQASVVTQDSPLTLLKVFGMQNAEILKQKTKPLLQKLKQMERKKLIAGIVCALVVIFFIRHAVSGKSDVSKLTLVGNTTANIENSGIIAGTRDFNFFVDNNYHDLMLNENGGLETIYQNRSKEFSCLSYYDGILYFLYGGEAHTMDAKTRKDEVIPELKNYAGNISRLYITTGYYFIYADNMLYRISRKTGKEEQSIYIKNEFVMSLYDGWLYYAEWSSSGKNTEIIKVPAGDFDKVQDDNTYKISGTVADLTVDENYVYVSLYKDNELFVDRIPSDLKDVRNECEWDMSAFDQGVMEINVTGENLFCSVYDGEWLSVYRLVISEDGKGDYADYDYDCVSYAAYNPCILEDSMGFTLYCSAWDNDSLITKYLEYDK